MAQDRVITLSAAAGVASCTIIIGQANAGAAAVYLFEPNRTDFRELGSGETPVLNTLTFVIGKPSALGGRFLQWDAAMAPHSGASGQLYSVTLTIFQDDAVVTTFRDTGQFQPDTDQALVRRFASIIVT